MLEEIKVGDKVIMTEFTKAAYQAEWIKSHESVQAEVVECVHKKVPFASLNDKGKDLYRITYGLKKEYDIYEMKIRFPNEPNALYIVSQFGFEKVPT